MANCSNWKGSEAKAAKLFPGGKRRTRVGGGTYSTVADDVVWGPERLQGSRPPRVIKETMISTVAGGYPPVYIEVKKRARVEAISIFRESEKKYFTEADNKLALVLHVKGEQRQFVMVSDGFFYELIRAWCRERNLFLEAMNLSAVLKETSRQ